MKPNIHHICLLGAALVLAILLPTGVGAYELEEGLNLGGVIDHPTALDQPVDNIVSGSVEIYDLAEPDLRTRRLHYGAQYGNFQFLFDGNWGTTPEVTFDRAVLRAKLRMINFDEYRTHVAFGALGRWVEKAEEKDERIDGREISLLGILTTELFPLPQWGGILVNAYLDNRFGSLGLKAQLYPAMQFIVELDYLHTTEKEERFASKTGLEFEGEQNFFAQLYYDTQNENMIFRLGTAF